MKFSELPVGARFRFFARGLLHEKVSGSSYSPLTGGTPSASSPEANVLPEDEHAMPVNLSDVPAKPVDRKSSEDQARELLERIGVPNTKKFTSAALAELAALIERSNR
jgi:hypothetical protein